VSVAVPLHLENHARSVRLFLWMLRPQFYTLRHLDTPTTSNSDHTMKPYFTTEPTFSFKEKYVKDMLRLRPHYGNDLAAG